MLLVQVYPGAIDNLPPMVLALYLSDQQPGAHLEQGKEPRTLSAVHESMQRGSSSYPADVETLQIPGGSDRHKSSMQLCTGL